MKEYFEELSDSRQQGKIKYNLVETVICAIVAITAGAEHWNEIEMYCKSKIEILREKLHLELNNGIPTDDTFQHIFAIIIPSELEKCFRNWANSIADAAEEEIISLDGKTLRGSRDDNFNVIHMVSAWANKNGLVLGQLRVDDKSNEIPAVPKLLDLLDVKGCTITSDAMSCQKKTVRKIVDKQCDYVICLKGNQETFHEDVKLYFNEPQMHKLSKFTTLEKSHGRIEKREYFLSDEVKWIENYSEWAGLKAIGMVKSTRIVNSAESTENRYFISSVTDVKRFAESVRKHWGIENNLHWCLDVDFNEDKCRMRVDNSAENLAVIRHIALNLYKSYKVPKLSVKAKRFRCSFDDDFLCDVILNKFL